MRGVVMGVRAALGRIGVTAACCGVALSITGQGAGAQETGTLAGVIVSTVTEAPLPRATVSIIGLDLKAVTDETGAFLIEGVPPGFIRARFESEGHMSVVEELQASVGAFLRVRLSPVEAVLDEIMVLVGQPRNSDGAQQLTVDRQDGGGRTVLDLLADQVPGVVVRRGGGNIGSGAYVYIRGTGSFSSDLAPDIYLDGIRVDSRNTDERSTHILDVISAEDVASVRVFKGAAGGAGLPLGGANGAIIIETNQGPSTPQGN